MHVVKQLWSDLSIGDEVAIHGIDFVCRVVRKEGTRLVVEFDWWYDAEFPASVVSETVDFARYEYSYLCTPDNKQHAPLDDWSQVETAYGINHLGSSDTDPVRSLAFRVLQGDVEAYKVVGNLLARPAV